jgi:hypothetical protein
LICVVARYNCEAVEGTGCSDYVATSKAIDIKVVATQGK